MKTTKKEVKQERHDAIPTLTLKRHAKRTIEKDGTDCLPLNVMCDDLAKSLSLCRQEQN
jgi:hypothetical protein